MLERKGAVFIVGKLWQNFTKVIDKAKEACVNVGQKALENKKK